MHFYGDSWYEMSGQINNYMQMFTFIIIRVHPGGGSAYLNMYKSVI